MDKNKEPQTTHVSEQNEEIELIEIASSLITDYKNEDASKLLEYAARLIGHVNND